MDLRQLFNSVINFLADFFRLNLQPVPHVGYQPFTAEVCRTRDGEVCMLWNLERLPKDKI